LYVISHTEACLDYSLETLVEFHPNFTGDQYQACACFQHFQVNWLCQSYDPLMMLFLKFVRNTPLTAQMQFQRNFTGLTSTTSTCSYGIARVFNLNDFGRVLVLEYKRVFFRCQLHWSLPGLLLGNYWCNFIQTLHE
jgi:hypothetical protein